MLNKINSPRLITNKNAITNRNNEIASLKHGKIEIKHRKAERHPKIKTQAKLRSNWQAIRCK
jgi:hypothetical protein